MRHRKRRTKLNRTTAHRKATLGMIAKSLFIHQSIKTTSAKAKEAKKRARGARDALGVKRKADEKTYADRINQVPVL